MERRPYIVLGEAPESDSEEEVNISVVSIWTVFVAVCIFLMRRENRPQRNSTVLFQFNFIL
jgi:hypothetical protein